MSNKLGANTANYLLGAPVRLAFKPDYYDWWCRFSDFQLCERLRRMKWEEATLLMPENIRQSFQINEKNCEREFSRYISESIDYKKSCIFEILSRVGISSCAARSISSVDRHEFSPSQYIELAYTNVSLPYSKDSWMTTWGLTAILLDKISKLRFSRIIEIGAGKGCQSSALIRFIGNADFYTGYEANQILINDAIPKLVKDRIIPRPFKADEHKWKSNDLLVFSASPNDTTRLILLNSMPIGSSVIWTEPVGQEFFQNFLLGKLLWGSEVINSYEQYLEFPQSYMMLVCKKRFIEGIVSEVISYNTQYVLETPDFYSDIESVNDPTMDFMKSIYLG